MCANGDIPSVMKFGRSWAIPESSERPNGRVTTGSIRTRDEVAIPDNGTIKMLI